MTYDDMIVLLQRQADQTNDVADKGRWWDILAEMKDLMDRLDAAEEVAYNLDMIEVDKLLPLSAKLTKAQMLSRSSEAHDLIKDSMKVLRRVYPDVA